MTEDRDRDEITDRLSQSHCNQERIGVDGQQRELVEGVGVVWSWPVEEE